MLKVAGWAVIVPGERFFDVKKVDEKGDEQEEKEGG